MDIHVHDTYFIIAHFHYIMVGGAILGCLGGLHYWWPKITGRMYPEGWAKFAALIIFVGFNLTFFPQFIAGLPGHAAPLHAYPPEFQVLNVLSTAGASILGVGYLIPLIYFTWSLKYGPIAGPNPWGAAASNGRHRRRRPQRISRRRQSSRRDASTMRPPSEVGIV